MFGIALWIPADMIASKQGKDFLWLSNNSATMMQNIVVYRDWSPVTASDVKANHGGRDVKTVGYGGSEARGFISARDYVLGCNILGETDSMHMATVPESVLTDGRGFYRGLWMMTGDAMGGPFVSRAGDKATWFAAISSSRALCSLRARPSAMRFAVSKPCSIP